MHHTHTNVLGKDRDIGYGVLRMSEDQPWQPYYLGNPAYAVLLALLFQWGVALHDLEVEQLERRQGVVEGQGRDAAGDLEKGPPAGAEGLRAVPAARRPGRAVRRSPAT